MKDAYYFSHDSNARNDQRLIKLRMKYGMKGYGIYFGIIEILRDQENYILFKSDIESISYDLRVERDVINDIIHEYNLFEWIYDKTNEEGYFHSKSLTRRMDKLDKIKETRRASGKKGAKATAKVRQIINNETANAETHETANAEQLKESKANKSIEDKKKEKKISLKTGKFKKKVFEFQSKYELDMLEEFIDYWTETNKSRTKIKWEMEETWDMGKRLARWANSNYQSVKAPGKQQRENGKIDEATSGRYKNLADQSKRFKRYMDDSLETAADPQEIGQILGETLKKIKPSYEEEEDNGQQDLHRD